MKMKVFQSVLIVVQLSITQTATAFVPGLSSSRVCSFALCSLTDQKRVWKPWQPTRKQSNLLISLRSSKSAEDMSDEEKEQAVGNLVADDEWNGMAMELSEVIKTAVIEDFKRKGREFLGKDEYQVGDLSKEIDVRVKEGVANLRGKDKYEVGDFVLAMDEMSKSLTEELTGKPYEAGDLSKEIDARVKKSVASYIGKDEYQAGDLTKALAEKIKARTDELTANYEFGDITREVGRRRKEWVESFLGPEAASNYQFGDITKKAFTKITGKDTYEFGDVTKKLVGDFFGKKDKK